MQLQTKLEKAGVESEKKTSRESAVAINWVKEHGAAVTAIFLVISVAAIHVFRFSMWYDEAVTMLTVSGHAQTDFSLGMEQFKPDADFRRITFDLYNQDVHPPLYFWVLAIWRMVFGASLEVARSLSALFVAGTCLLLCRLARDADMRWPWIPMAVYGFGAAGIDYAWNARPYAMASFLILLTHLLAQKRSRWAGICGTAAIATHYFAALCVAPILLLQSAETWKSDRAWVKQTTATLVIGVAPLLMLLRIHLTARPQQYPNFGPWRNEVWALLQGSIADALPNSMLPGWGFAMALAAVCVLAGIAWALKHGKYFVPLAYLIFLSGFFVLAMLTNKSIAKMPDAYYLGIAAPWLGILAGYGVNTRPRWSPLLMIAVAAGSITAGPLVSSPNYRELTSRIRAECNDCVVIVGNGYAGAVPACILYESDGMRVVTANRGDTPQTIANRAGHQQPVVFVKTNEPPTAKVEEEFVEAYPSVWRGGYFEVFTEGRPKPRTVSDEADRMASPSLMQPRGDQHP